MLTTNVGNLDRFIRIVAGLALIAAALGLYGPAYTTPWGWIGVVALVTGFVGNCPAYSLFGFKTCSN
jgi:hypothetical protein